MRVLLNGREYEGERMTESFEIRCPYSGEVRFYGVPGDYKLKDLLVGEWFGVKAIHVTSQR